MPSPAPTTSVGSITAAVTKLGDLPLGGTTVVLTGPTGRLSVRLGDDARQTWAGLPMGSYTVALGPLVNWTPTTPTTVPVVLTPVIPVAEVKFVAAPKVPAPGTVLVPKPATPTGTPTATLPTPPAAPLGGIVCGFGASASVRATYTVECPAVAHLDSRPLAPTLRGYTRIWTIGGLPDLQPDPRHALDPVAYPTPLIDRNVIRDVELIAVRCDVVGAVIVSLAITCTATGVTTHYAQTIVTVANARTTHYVGPAGNDANDGLTAATAWRTWAKARLIFAAARACLTVLGDLPDAATSDTRLGVEAALIARRKPDGTRPTLLVSGCPAFSGWDGATSGAVIRGLRVTANSPTVKPDTVNAVPVKTAAGSKFIVSRGDGVALDDCEFGTLEYGALVESGDGFALLDCVQPDPLSVQAQALMDLSAGTLIVAGGSLTGSQRESTVRLESGAKSAAFYGGLVAMRGGANGKAELTERVGHRIGEWAMAFDGGTNNAQVGASTTAGPGSAGNSTIDTLYSECLLHATSFNVTATVVGYSVLNCHVDPPAGIPHVTSSPPGVSDLIITGNTTASGPFRVKSAGVTPGLITDAEVTDASAKVVRPAVAVAAAVVFPA